jgi:hypothetical protein
MPAHDVASMRASGWQKCHDARPWNLTRFASCLQRVTTRSHAVRACMRFVHDAGQEFIPAGQIGAAEGVREFMGTAEETGRETCVAHGPNTEDASEGVGWHTVDEHVTGTHGVQTLQNQARV